MELATDLAFWSYGLNALVSLYGFLIFAWWWSKIGEATNVYIYITFLFLGQLVLFGGNTHIRIIRAIDPMAAIEFSDSLFWGVRNGLHLIICVLIVYKMTRRISRTIKSAKRFGSTEDNV